MDNLPTDDKEFVFSQMEKVRFFEFRRTCGCFYSDP